MSAIKDITGQKFGFLTAIKCVGRSKGKQALWLCKCDCGGESISQGTMLRYGTTTSCGCKFNGKLKQKHGCAIHGEQTTEYKTWAGIINRCTNKNDPGFRNYGSRGIIMCERWRNSFATFLADMGERPSDNHSIERKDNNGNYEPSNCRWATYLEQGNNRRTNRFIEYKGRNQTLIQWCRELNVSRVTIQYRLRVGMTSEMAFEKPCGPFIERAITLAQTP